MESSQSVTYCDGQTVVRLGDRVKVRLFLFLKRFGRVSYVPGVSPIHKEMEHDGIQLIGVNFEDGGSGGFWVDPTTLVVVKTVTFLGRDDSSVDELPSEAEWN
jgi:hypothetical protein